MSTCTLLFIDELFTLCTLLFTFAATLGVEPGGSGYPAPGGGALPSTMLAPTLWPASVTTRYPWPLSGLGAGVSRAARLLRPSSISRRYGAREACDRTVSYRLN